MADTIAALATPVGRSGIGVVRISGADALLMLAGLTSKQAIEIRPRTAQLMELFDPKSGGILDEAVITYFKAPASFTGEDVVEISCHGSPVVLRQVLDTCLELGARLATPGEFSLRAVANGKLDLSEAEAVRDLINAQTLAAARTSVRQMRGEFSFQLQPVKDELLDVIVVLESSLEFVEDDLPETETDEMRGRLGSLRTRISSLAGTFRAGRLIRDGLKVALVGRPNVGKSSLFNALLGSERAIVTDIPGTTRDQLHERLVIKNVPISLIDTAGLRETEDAVEKIGVERARRTLADSDLILVMFDAAEGLTDDDRELLLSVKEQNYQVLINKIDKIENETLRELMGSTRSILHVASGITAPAVEVLILGISAKTGSGLDELMDSIVDPFLVGSSGTDGFLVTDARHHDLLMRAAAEIGDAMDALNSAHSEEIILVGLHNALRYLGEITGETTTEDMLTRIFSTFCIGK
ncbi:tRNA uridine-5-carboxymethylaminomethyl(34) synthesis GTPase MnmE [Leptolyngbya sp. 7M]|uniref:tRNA uridine-5-carboxymethylaminomethyl(34) synthesis GTPase MnmE n=1 Tax=Leptolyngbya sp. 7M TaxID=2812896 RepID=UPI001B8D0B0F|nr:tRNA uridine-5-carboxymethylaminomethyl(34) synthesis GTPase MnmE [Leptolyngbya sp. 7M]QYO67584.1 tRNA uridine-5-carboxymethylaminomethyl(34) synthesis GTPase MnmE [Leptolyngbya sp. 7M]